MKSPTRNCITLGSKNKSLSR